MTPEVRAVFVEEYEAGELTEKLLKAKYGLTDYQFKTAVHIGRGNIIEPKPLVRAQGRVPHHVYTASELVTKNIDPKDLEENPMVRAANMDAKARDAALLLNDAELGFANNVLRGFNATAAAAASFEIFNKQMAEKKAAELLRSSHVAQYLSLMRGRTIDAPLRNRAYLEAVLWKVIDRSMELEQVYGPDGNEVEGKCEYDPKTAVAAANVLMKLKGWEKAPDMVGGTESQRDRLRRIQSQFSSTKQLAAPEDEDKD